MKTLRIQGIDYTFELGEGDVYNIKIDLPRFLYKLLRQIKEEEEDLFYLYENKLLDPFKYIAFVDDYFQLNMNSKKQLSTLYNKIEKEVVNDDSIMKLSYINEEICNLVQYIVNEYTVPLNFDASIDFKTLFSSVSLAYCDYSGNFLDNFCYLIRILKEQNNSCCLLITNNLFDFLEEDEIELLKKELSIYHLSLINIGSPKGIAKRVHIDNDLFEFLE